MTLKDRQRYLERLKSQRLLNALNENYAEPESSEETTLRHKSKSYYAERIQKQVIEDVKL